MVRLHNYNVLTNYWLLRPQKNLACGAISYILFLFDRTRGSDNFTKIYRLSRLPDSKSGKHRTTRDESVASARQIGQLEWENSHMSMHETWNECMHSGKVRNSSPSSNSLKHTAHIPSPTKTKPTSFWYFLPGMSSDADEIPMLPSVCPVVSGLKRGRVCRGWELRLQQQMTVQW